MAINAGSIGTKSITQNHKVVIEMIEARPTYGLPIADGLRRQPGQLVGFYNGVTAKVELFAIANDGFSAVKVG